MAFSTFMELCNHHHNPVLEYSHHPNKIPYAHLQSLPATHTPSTPAACGNQYAIFFFF